MTSDPIVTLFTALFLEPGAIDEAASLLRPEDFHQADHRRAFGAMLELAQSGKPIDCAHFVDRLVECGMSDKVALELMERLTDGDCLPGKIRDYAALVRKSSRKRRLMGAVNAAIARAESGVDAEEILCELQVDLWALQADRQESGPIAARDFIQTFLDRAAEERVQVGELAGLSMGLPTLDHMTTGIRPGELVVAGALPGRGKTSFGMQVAAAAAGRGVPVLVFSLEMTCVEIVRRVLGTRFGAWTLRTLRDTNEGTWNAIVKHAADVGTLPLFVDDTSSLTATELAARGRAAVRERGIKLIVVDYLQLLRGPEREIRERVGNAANILRQLAKDTQVPVLALSQLRRPGNLNDKPTMLDLKESGDIEAHAHTVLLLYQPLRDARPSGEDEIIIGKQRNGPLGTVPVVFDTRTLTFTPRSLMPDAAPCSRTWERDE